MSTLKNVAVIIIIIIVSSSVKVKGRLNDLQEGPQALSSKLVKYDLPYVLIMFYNSVLIVSLIFFPSLATPTSPQALEHLRKQLFVLSSSLFERVSCFSSTCSGFTIWGVRPRHLGYTDQTGGVTAISAHV